jgi:hypothetical protein
MEIFKLPSPGGGGVRWARRVMDTNHIVEKSSKVSLMNPAIIVALIAFCVRFWFLFVFSNTPFFEPISGGNDRALYDGLAQQIAKGKWFPDGVYEYMPLYPWLLGMIYSALGPNLFAVGLIGITLDAFTTFLIIQFALRMGSARWPAVLLGSLYALYPLAIAYSVVTMANTMNALLLTAFTYGMVVMHPLDKKTQSSSMGFAFILGFMGGITSLSFAGMLLIAVVGVAYLLIRQIQAKTLQPAYWLLFLIGFILPILPVTIHNWKAERQFVLVTAHGGFNFYMGNHENSTGYPVQIKNFRGDAGSMLVDARREAEKISGKKLSSAEFSSFWSSQAWEFIRTHPAQELKLMGIKFLKFWNFAEYDDLRLLPMLRISGVAFTSPLWTPFFLIAGMGLMGILVVRHRTLLHVITLSGMAGVMMFFITSRYRLTFVPLLCVFGALGLTQCIQWWKARKFVPPMFAAIFGFGVSLIPLAQTDFRALDCYNTAAFLLAKNQPKAAFFCALKGLTISPSDSRLHFVAGNALFGLKEYVDAAAAYQKAIELNPANAAAHYSLGRTWMMLHKPAEAAAEAELTLKHDPDHPRARELLNEANAAKKP